ncbi:nitronate monooxygenase [Alphaproteobacteria bacterium]|nr:nitronate monooxygenase [Alphaproteobacteria bacterium]
MKALNSLMMAGQEVLPLVEGGKGIAISNGESAGSWAAAGGIGTFSAVNADFYDEEGRIVSAPYYGKTRRERHHELIAYGIKGGVTQARIAHNMSSGKGRLNMNVLWEMGGAEPILHGILEQASDLIHGVTCGAGMPYRIAEIAAKYGISYYPIVSSARAFRALWKRSFHKYPEGLGGVVYEDPWLAGGHNGLSNVEDPTKPEDPFPRVLALRQLMNSFSLHNVPIIMAGGVWFLRDWTDWIDSADLGPVAFQFGTRPLITQESPISSAWKERLLTLKPGDVYLNRFSPTGFYSSGVRNGFIQELVERNERQVSYRRKEEEGFTAPLAIGQRGRTVFVAPEDQQKVANWQSKGFSDALRTPDKTLIFVTPDKGAEIHKDQVDCMGCLSACRFSNWAQSEEGTTGLTADPRSFCIQKSLQDISHGGSLDHNLMFAGHNAYKFGQDPFYENGFIPTVKQLVERIATGD